MESFSKGFGEMKISVSKIIYLLLSLMVFFIPMEELVGLGDKGSGTLLRYLGLLNMPLFFFDMLKRKQFHRWAWEQKTFFCFVVWVSFSTIWTHDLSSTQTLVFTYLSLFLFVWLIISYADTFSKISSLSIVFIAGCLFSWFLGRASLTGSAVEDTGYLRYSAGGLDLNDCSFVLNLGCLCTFMQVFLSRSRLRALVFIFISMILAYGVMSTGSRAGFYGLSILGLGVAHFLRTRVSKSLFWVLFIPFLLGAIFILPSTSVWQRASEGTSASTYLLRQKAWTVGLSVWKDVPLQGVGAGAFVPSTVSITRRETLVAHNTFVSVLVELGIVGEVLYFSTFILLLGAGWKQLRLSKGDSKEEGVYKYFLGLLVFLMFFPAFLSLTFEYKKMLWFAVGMSIACRRALIYERKI